MTSGTSAAAPERGAVAGLIALLLGGLALRAPGLLDRPLWLDEAVQVGVATAPALHDALVRDDLHPPLLALLLRGWLTASHDPAWIRLPSLLASLATIPVAHVAAARWSPEQPVRAGLTAAAWTAVLPPFVVYAAEARPYALLGLWSMALVALVPRRQLGAATVAALLASATHYGTWPLAWCAVLLAGRRHRVAARLGAALLLGSLQSALVAFVLLAQRAGPGAALGRGSLGPWLAGDATWVWRGPLGALGWLVTGRADAIATAVGALVATVLLATAARTRGRRGLTVLVVGPTLALAAAALIGAYPLGPTRHALVLMPALVVWGATRLGWREAWSLPALVLTAGLAALAPRPPVQRVADAIGEHRPVVADGSAAPIVRWYGPSDAVMLDWWQGPRLAGALDAQAPAGPFWFVWTSARPAAEDDLRAWAGDRGRALGARRDAEGASVLWVGPAP